MALSGIQRLSVFVAIVWIGFWAVACSLDSPDSWGCFLLFGIAPAAVALGVPWGIWWVVAGFRNQRGK